MLKFKGKPFNEYSPCEAAEITYGKSNVCRLCKEPVVMVPDKTALPVYHYKKLKNGKETGEIIQVAYPSKPHETHLCYYHLAKLNGEWELKFPLFRNAVENAIIRKECLAKFGYFSH